MAKKGHSDPDLFGGYTHYDEHGKKTGSSRPGLFGGYVDYDAKHWRANRLRNSAGSGSMYMGSVCQRF